MVAWTLMIYISFPILVNAYEVKSDWLIKPELTNDASLVGSDASLRETMLSYSDREELINLLGGLGRFLESLENTGVDFYCSSERSQKMKELHTNVSGDLKLLLEYSFRETGKSCSSIWDSTLSEWIKQNKGYDIVMNRLVGDLTNSSSTSDWDTLHSIVKLREQHFSLVNRETLLRRRVAWEQEANEIRNDELSTTNLSAHKDQSLSEFCSNGIISFTRWNIGSVDVDQLSVKVRKWLEFYRFCHKLIAFHIDPHDGSSVLLGQYSSL